MTSMTVLEDIVARIGVEMEGVAKAQKEQWEAHKGLAEAHKGLAEAHKDLAEAHKENERVLTEKLSGLSAHVDKVSAHVDRVSANVDRMSANVNMMSTRIDKVSAHVDKVSAHVDKVSANVDRVSANLEKWTGRFGDKIGYLIERILIPGVKPIMNEYGHDFTSVSVDKKYYVGSKGRRFAEVDLFLENGDEAMAVEVKTRLQRGDVDYHLKRLQTLRENEAVSGLRGKTLYSAMAGLQIDSDAREIALNAGMYVIEMVEDARYVNVVKPPDGPGKW